MMTHLRRQSRHRQQSRRSREQGLTLELQESLETRYTHDAVPVAPVQAQRAERAREQAGGGTLGCLLDLEQLLARASVLHRWSYLCSDTMRRLQTDFTTPS